MKGLIVVDVQKDFCPGGALATEEGDNIIPAINKLMDKFDLVAASKDWHPAETVHFENWPVHCVRGSEGAKFHEQLNADKITEVALKGTGNTDDGYSAFEATNVDLYNWLSRNKISEVYVCGIATEYCVKATALDAKKSGFNTYVVKDAIAAVEAKPGDTENALAKMQEEGIKLISLEDI